MRTIALVLATLFAAPGAPARADAPTPAPVSLTPEAAAALRDRVMVQCGLAPAARDALPWYFHFEYGSQLLAAGDARRAIDHLSRSVDLHQDPGAAQRVYGMWYIDYAPYLQLADAHARLGNWPCAASALALSDAKHESAIATPAGLDPDRVRRAIDAHREGAGADPAGACAPGDGAPGWKAP